MVCLTVASSRWTARSKYLSTKENDIGKSSGYLTGVAFLATGAGKSEWTVFSSPSCAGSSVKPRQHFCLLGPFAKEVSFSRRFSPINGPVTEFGDSRWGDAGWNGNTIIF